MILGVTPTGILCATTVARITTYKLPVPGVGVAGLAGGLSTLQLTLFAASEDI